MRFAVLFFPFFLLCLASQAQQNDSITSQKLSEIEISGAKISTSQSATPLQVITEDDILKQGIQSVSDAIRRLNGVLLKDYGGIGGLKTVSIRGMGAEYTTISYDGMVVNNLQSGQVDIGRFTLDNISVLSLSIGQADDIFLTAKSYTTSGILNLQTKVPSFSGDERHKVHGKITTGSFGHFEPMLDYAYKLSNKITLAANVNWQRADGRYKYEEKKDVNIPNRKRSNSDTDILRSEINVYTTLSPNDKLDVKLYYFDSERGLPGGVRLNNPEDKDERLWDKDAFAQVSYNKKIDTRWKLKSIAKYEYTHQKYRQKIFTEGGKYYWGDNKYKQNEVYWSNTALYQIIPALSVSLSQDLLYNTLRSEFVFFNVSRSEPNRYSSFSALTAQYKIGRLSITASGLNTYVREEIKGKDNHKSYKKLSPAFSASFKPITSTNLRLRASYKHIYRIPTFSELFYVATGRKLNPESSSQYNLGATWVGKIHNTPIEYINISVDGYYNDVKDKIIIIPNPSPTPSVMNKGKVEMKGVDAKIATSIGIRKDMSLYISGVYNYMNAYNADKKESTYNKQLIYTPKHSGSVSLTLNNPWVDLSYAVLASDIRYTSLDNKKDEKLDSYSEHSITLFKEMTFSRYKVYANASVLNLLNKTYNIIAFYPMPGRSFKVSVGCKF